MAVKVIKKELKFGEHTLTIETGEIARQASSVIVDLGGTTVLVTAVGVQSLDSKDFFPLRVDYQEKAYASGKIPGGFFKREGRPTEREILISRLMDRPIRPLFPKGFCSEVQVVATLLSLNPAIESDIPAMIGASAALAISGMPFQGPMGAARVGYQNGQFILNPTQEQLITSELDLVVAGTDTSVLMVESEAKNLSEATMLEAVMFGHQAFQSVIQAIQSLADSVNPTPWIFESPQLNEARLGEICVQFGKAIEAAYLIKDKVERQSKLKEVRAQIIEQFVTEDADESIAQEVSDIIAYLEKKVVRDRILQGNPRIDGRDLRTVRPISIRAGLLNRTHGSALFTRGETQALVTVTLGSAKDAQILDTPFGEIKDTFMLHYNFPPYSVGEVGMVGSPKRREIGHGRLAKRGLLGVMPVANDFPYVVRVVSEITESNGSSSMASVCGGSLALMQAGVPLKAPVAGIAMGLIKEGDQFAVLTDILGDEDHLGDMDFKVAGTHDGVTALQMDIKIAGITKEIMEKALSQAKEGRLHILGEMNKCIQKPSEDVSKYAPRLMSFYINPDKIKDVIGKGGATIRSITEETGVTIDIQDDGRIEIAAENLETGQAARKRIEQLTTDVEVGNIYDGRVVKLVDFGAFVSLLPGKEGLVHISQIAHKRVENVKDELEEGQSVRVKLIEIDKQGRLKLSIKAVDTETAEEDASTST